MLTIGVLKITLGYLLIAEIIEMAQHAPMVNLPCSPLLLTDWFLIIMGVRQVFIISPSLFNIFLENVMRASHA